MLVKLATIDQVNNAWIEQGNKVNDISNKLTAMAMDDSFDKDEFAKVKDEKDTAVAQRDALHDQLEDLQNQQAQEVANSIKKNEKTGELTDKEKDLKDKFVKNFKDMMQGKIVNEVTSSLDESGNMIGLTIPTDVQTAIHELTRQYQSLVPFVSVESTTMPTGSRVWEKWSDVTPLANLDDETATIGDNDDPALTLVKYAIKRYAGITTATNTLLKDSAENILAWLTKWIARKVVVTRNKQIIAVFDKAEVVTISKFDDIKDLTLTKLDPAINQSAIALTNQTGFAVLAKIKDAMGRYLLTRDPTQPDSYLLEGKTITVIGNKWLPDDTDGNHPLYYGDGQQYATLFDREQMSLLSTNIGGKAFETDSTKVRVIDRFDVEITDSEALVKATFKDIADQPANFAASK